jgi:hypothetical protein
VPRTGPGVPTRRARAARAALALAAWGWAAAALAGEAAPAAASTAYDPFEDEPPGAEAPPRLLLTAWGGALVGVPGSGRASGGFAGGEATFRLAALDLGVQALAARLGPEGGLSPVVLLRLGQRFETRRGVEGSLTLGLGAARRDAWEAWFQVALGARVPLGPVFLATELAFEQVDLIRLAVGLGAGF